MRSFVSLLAIGLCGCSASVVDGTSSSGAGGSGGGASSVTTSSSAASGGAGGGSADAAWSLSFGRKNANTWASSPIPDAEEAAHFGTSDDDGSEPNELGHTRSIVVDRAGAITADTKLPPDSPSWVPYPGGGFVELGVAPAGTSTVRGLALNCAASCSYLVRADASGHGLWVSPVASEDSGAFYLVTVAPDGTIRVGGFFSGALTLGSDTVSAAGPNDTFVASLDAGGQPLWLRSIASASGDNYNMAYTLAVDPAGDVAVSGRFHGTLELGDGASTSSDTTGVWGDGGFVEKLDPAGSVLVLKAYGGDSNGASYLSTALTGDGSIVLSGGFSGTVDFGGGQFSAGEDGADLTVELGPDGTFRWMQPLSRFAAPQRWPAVASTSDGHVWLAGQLTSSAEFGGKTLTPVADTDALLVEIDAQGSVVTTRQFGSAGNQWFDTIAIGSDGSLFASGQFDTKIDFGQGPLAAVGATDAFVARIFP